MVIGIDKFQFIEQLWSGSIPSSVILTEGDSLCPKSVQKVIGRIELCREHEVELGLIFVSTARSLQQRKNVVFVLATDARGCLFFLTRIEMSRQIATGTSRGNHEEKLIAFFRGFCIALLSSWLPLQLHSA